MVHRLTAEFWVKKPPLRGGLRGQRRRLGVPVPQQSVWARRFLLRAGVTQGWGRLVNLPWHSAPPSAALRFSGSSLSAFRLHLGLAQTPLH